MNFLLHGFGAIPFFVNGLFGADTEFGLQVLACFAVILIAYLLGSINSSVIASRAIFSKDIRDSGSGNAGLTNMYRVYGARGAVWTLLGDLLKSIVAVLCGMALMGYAYGGHLAILFCVLGHAYPCYFRFRGGKGVLSAAACIFCLSPITFLILIALFLLMVLATKYVSVGSITAAFFYPLIYRAFCPGLPFLSVSSSILTCLLVIFWHRANVKRLIAGTEHKFGEKKDPDPKSKQKKD